MSERNVATPQGVDSHVDDSGDPLGSNAVAPNADAGRSRDSDGGPAARNGGARGWRDRGGNRAAANVTADVTADVPVDVAAPRSRDGARGSAMAGADYLAAPNAADTPAANAKRMAAVGTTDAPFVSADDSAGDVSAINPSDIPVASAHGMAATNADDVSVARAHGMAATNTDNVPVASADPMAAAHTDDIPAASADPMAAAHTEDTPAASADRVAAVNADDTLAADGNAAVNTRETHGPGADHRHPGVSTPRVRNSGLILAILLTCQLMLVLDATVMNVALPHIQADLHFTSTGLSWVLNAYTLVFGGLLLLGGRAGDIVGRRTLFIGGLTLFTVASLAGGFTPSAGLLIAARIAQGVGAAAAGPSALALITTTFTEPTARIRALSIFSGTSVGGFAIGLMVGGLLTQWTTWRAVLFINVPFGIAAIVLACLFLHEPARHTGRLDLPGALTGTAGIGSLVYGFIEAATIGWRHTTTFGWLVAGILFLAAFLVLESRSPQPLLPLRIFANRDRSAAFLNFCLGPMAMMSTFFFLTQFLQEVLRFSPLRTGLAFLALAVPLFAITRLMPILLPRLGPKPLTLIGTALLIAGLLWLTRLTPTGDYPHSLLGPLLLLGLGGGLGFSPLNVVIMNTVPPRDAGVAGGVLQTLQQTGATLGLAILVTIFGPASRQAAEHGATAAQALVSGITMAFATSVGFAVASFLVALTFRRISR